MQVAVVGCTGGVGRQIVQQALARGWTVIAPCRSPAKLDQYKCDRLRVIEADLYNEAELAGHLAGCDAVLSCLGCDHLPWPWKTLTTVRDFTKVLLGAMKKASVSRLVIISSWCTVSKPGNPKMIEWVIKPLVLKPALDDLAVMETIIEGQTEVKYTIVKPPGLVDDPITELEIHTSDLEHVPDRTPRMPRADVARFMLACLDTEDWANKKVSIAL